MCAGQGVRGFFPSGSAVFSIGAIFGILGSWESWESSSRESSSRCASALIAATTVATNRAAHIATFGPCTPFTHLLPAPSCSPVPAKPPCAALLPLCYPRHWTVTSSPRSCRPLASRSARCCFCRSFRRAPRRERREFITGYGRRRHIKLRQAVGRGGGKYGRRQAEKRRKLRRWQVEVEARESRRNHGMRQADGSTPSTEPRI
jgi:hypothetical protein